jgi:hypothetical protein
VRADPLDLFEWVAGRVIHDADLHGKSPVQLFYGWFRYNDAMVVRFVAG